MYIIYVHFRYVILQLGKLSTEQLSEVLVVLWELLPSCHRVLLEWIELISEHVMFKQYTTMKVWFCIYIVYRQISSIYTQYIYIQYIIICTCFLTVYNLIITNQITIYVQLKLYNLCTQITSSDLCILLISLTNIRKSSVTQRAQYLLQKTLSYGNFPFNMLKEIITISTTSTQHKQVGYFFIIS